MPQCVPRSQSPHIGSISRPIAPPVLEMNGVSPGVAQPHATQTQRSLLAKVRRRSAALPGTMFDHREQLTLSEREALQKAVSADHLEKQGLREGTHGEILNERGRTVFDIGFARAIRKILGN